MNTWSQQDKNYTNLLLTGYECKPVKTHNRKFSDFHLPPPPLPLIELSEKYRKAQPFNLPAQPFNLSISDKLWTLEKNKGHFIILELNSGIIKWPYFLPKVFSL